MSINLLRNRNNHFLFHMPSNEIQQHADKITMDVILSLLHNSVNKTWHLSNTMVFTATCFSNVAVMGSLDVRPSVRNVGDS